MGVDWWLMYTLKLNMHIKLKIKEFDKQNQIIVDERWFLIKKNCVSLSLLHKCVNWVLSIK